MKLKPVVASLFVLGLVSGSALATGKQTLVQQAVVDNNSVTSPVCTDNWFNRISIGGIGSVVGTYGNTDPAGTLFPTAHSTDLYVNNFNILANAVINSWTKATLNLAYIGYPSHVFVPSFYHSDWNFDLRKRPILSIDIDWMARRSTDNKIKADEAYLTFAKLDKYPVYFKIGKQYIPFGTYSNPYNFVLTPMTQMLSQTNQTAAVLGLATDFGLYANVYAFRGNSQPSSASGGMIRNYGAQLGFYDNLSRFGVSDAHYNLNVGAIRAIQDGDYWTKTDFMSEFFHYSDPVAGISLHGDLSWQAFDLSANYVQALKDVQGLPDMPGWLNKFAFIHSIFPIVPTPDQIRNGIINAIYGKDSNRKIWAADVNAGYAFNVWDHNSRIGLSYQFGGNGQFLADTFHVGFPKTRIQADYKVNLLKNVDFDVAVAHNRSYDYRNTNFQIGNIFGFNSGLPNGTETSNVVAGTLSFQF